MYLPVDRIKFYKRSIKSRVPPTLAYLRLSLLSACEKGLDLFRLLKLVYFNEILILLDKNYGRFRLRMRVLFDLEVLFKHHGSAVILYVAKKLS